MSSGEALPRIDVYETEIFPSGIVSPRLHARRLSGEVEDFIGRERVARYLQRCNTTHGQLLRSYSVDDKANEPLQIVEALLNTARTQWELREVLTAKELTAVTATDPNARPGFATHYAQGIKSPNYPYNPLVDDIDGASLAKLMLTEKGEPTRLLKEVIQTRVELDLSIVISAVALGITGASLATDYAVNPDVRKHFPASTLSRIGEVSNKIATMDVTSTVGSHLHPRSLDAVDQALEVTSKNGLRIPHGVLPSGIARPLEKVDQILLRTIAIRNEPEAHDLYTNEPTTYRYHPSNMDFAGPQPAREAIHITKPLSPEELEAMRLRAEAARTECAAQAEAERLAAEHAQAALDESEQPKIAALNTLAAEYSELLQPFHAPKKPLRNDSIFGNNSLQYQLRSKLPSVEGSAIDSMATTYYGLFAIAEEGEAPLDTLTDILTRADLLAGEYHEQLRAARLKGRAKPDKLIDDPKSDFLLLVEHWPKVKSAIADSAHRQHLTPERLELIEQMLGLRDIITEPTETPAITPSPLEIANAQSEKLDYILLPEAITAQDLVKIAEEARATRGNGSTPRREIEPYRMQTLLDFRDMFDAELLQSAERILGDSDDVYFIITFTNPDDGNDYAILEHPVYGNATYLMRKDTTALLPGETLLAAARQDRNVIRGCGAIQLAHPDNRTGKLSEADLIQAHTDAIFERLARLESRPSIV